MNKLFPPKCEKPEPQLGQNSVNYRSAVLFSIIISSNLSNRSIPFLPDGWSSRCLEDV